MSGRRQAGAPANGTMPLAAHLRELRSRLVKALLALLIGTILGFVFYNRVLELLTHPYLEIAPDLKKQGIDTSLTINGVGGAFSFQLKIALICGILVSSPVWFWQLWAFVLPALHRHEKRWAFLLTATAIPLFLTGAATAYYVLPKGLLVLIGFVPHGFQSLVSGTDYLDFLTRTMLVFGVAAELPLAIFILNRLGVVSARQLVNARPWIIVGIFVFAAVATPSTDPLTMLFLAVPMTLLYFLSEVVARLTDRRRAKDSSDWDDDTLSPIE